VPTGIDGDYWMRRSSRRMTSERLCVNSTGIRASGDNGRRHREISVPAIILQYMDDLDFADCRCLGGFRVNLMKWPD
jgi:hypothetical protein